MPTPSRLVIATRESRLALWQASHLRDRLAALYPDATIEILGMTTTGDQILDRTLAKVGGKGLFVKELELALMAGRADFAVHSAKDVPMEIAPAFELMFVGPREDACDALVSPHCRAIRDLPMGARVGTSSLRRQSQLLHLRPDLRIDPLRGNLDTRLRKLDEGQYDAILLAAAGLIRLGYSDRIAARLSAADSLPAVGQGAIAIEYRRQDLAIQSALAPLEDATVASRVRAERAFSRRLAGSCDVPLGAHAERLGETLNLAGFVATPDGRTILREAIPGPASAPEALGERLADRLIERGAQSILGLRHARG